MKKLFILFILFITGLSFRFLIKTDEPVFVPPSPQRTGGDSAKGYDYLINGDYVRGGVPEMIFRKTIGKPTIYLERNAAIYSSLGVMLWLKIRVEKIIPDYFFLSTID